MQAINLDNIETIEIQSELDPAMRVRVGFPISSATGTAASASVYFELDPGAHLGVHTDSAEEFLIILEGEGEGLVEPVADGDCGSPGHAAAARLAHEVPPGVLGWVGPA